MNEELVPADEQMARHGAAHDPEADESHIAHVSCSKLRKSGIELPAWLAVSVDREPAN